MLNKVSVICVLAFERGNSPQEPSKNTKNEITFFDVYPFQMQICQFRCLSEGSTAIKMFSISKMSEIAPLSPLTLTINHKTAQ